jgi:hypothetical protein
MRGEGGSCGFSANEYSCTHGAQINFGDLTPYLTCDLYTDAGELHVQKDDRDAGDGEDKHHQAGQHHCRGRGQNWRRLYRRGHRSGIIQIEIF